MCVQSSMIELAYENGVPMGGDLAARPKTDTSPKFIAAAMLDPAKDATPLKKLQLIKVWLDAEGRPHNEVHKIAGSPDNNASVDIDTGE